METRSTPAPHTDRCQLLQGHGQAGSHFQPSHMQLTVNAVPEAPVLHCVGSGSPCRKCGET